MEQFKSVCKSLCISDENIANEWTSKIERQYLKPNRYYHNISMLDKKMALIGEVVESESLKSALILASIFQYYHFDAKVDRREENCDELKLFADQAGLDVSVLSHPAIIYLKLIIKF